MPVPFRRPAPVLAAILLPLLAASCTRLPPVQRSADLSPARLHDHVAFLASPDLAGRAPRTAGSTTARRYLTTRLESFGLRPWAHATSFDLPFVLGTNVVAVLPGSDPAVSNQFVFLTAHYDHLGRMAGHIHPGACDNASGDAALLEIAQTLSRRHTCLKRPIAFAFFDCEEMGCLGSLAFTARDDVDPKSLAAAVNIDMLGRRTLDSLDALIVGGTGDRPALRALARDACQRHGLEFLPLGRELVGPRSDHIAFEGLAVPTLCVTSGPNPDYHQPTDTPDRIDASLLLRHTQAAADLVTALADAPSIPAATPPQSGDLAELDALVRLCDRAAAHPKSAGLRDLDPAPLRAVADDARRARALGPAYSLDDRRRLLASATERLMPLLLGQSLPGDYRLSLLIINDLYVHHVQTYARVLRDALREVARRDPDLLHPLGHLAISATAIDANSVLLTPLPDGRQRLSICVPLVELTADVDRFGHGSVNFAAFPWSGDLTGTRDELIDYALLCWHTAKPGSMPIWRHIMTRLTNEDHGDQLAAWQDALRPLPPGTTEDRRLRDLTRSPNPAVARAAVNVAPQATLIEILDDPAAPPRPPRPRRSRPDQSRPTVPLRPHRPPPRRYPRRPHVRPRVVRPHIPLLRHPLAAIRPQAPARHPAHHPRPVRPHRPPPPHQTHPRPRPRRLAPRPPPPHHRPDPLTSRMTPPVRPAPIARATAHPVVPRIPSPAGTPVGQAFPPVMVGRAVSLSPLLLDRIIDAPVLKRCVSPPVILPVMGLKVVELHQRVETLEAELAKAKAK